METVAAHRKLIDLKPVVFDTLSEEAKYQGLSLKRYIERILEEAALAHTAEFSPQISRLIGSARPKGMDLSSIEDDRLQYLLSK